LKKILGRWSSHVSNFDVADGQNRGEARGFFPFFVWRLGFSAAASCFCTERPSASEHERKERRSRPRRGNCRPSYWNAGSFAGTADPGFSWTANSSTNPLMRPRRPSSHTRPKHLETGPCICSGGRTRSGELSGPEGPGTRWAQKFFRRTTLRCEFGAEELNGDWSEASQSKVSGGAGGGVRARKPDGRLGRFGGAKRFLPGKAS